MEDLFSPNRPEPSATMLSPLPGDIDKHFELIENLARALPSTTGNTLLLFWLGIPTPSAGLLLPEISRERMDCRMYFDTGADGTTYIRQEGATGNRPIHEVRLQDLPVDVREMVRRRIRKRLDRSD